MGIGLENDFGQSYVYIRKTLKTQLSFFFFI